MVDLLKADTFTCRLAEHDIVYDLGGCGFPMWGNTGTKLLSWVEEIVRREMNRACFQEVITPSLCHGDDLEHFLKDKMGALIGTDFLDDDHVVLAPFSDFLYLQWASERQVEGHRNESKNYCWSETYRKLDRPSNPFHWAQYRKFEAFALTEQTDAAALWTEMNEVFKRLFSESFAVSPLYGERPRVVVFPGSERSFSAELSLGEGRFQTMVVTHIMKRDMIPQQSIGNMTSPRFISACFNQSCLLAVLAHHADGDGLRIPPPIAPWRGWVLSDDPSGAAFRLADTEPRVSLAESGQRPMHLLRTTGACWVIEAHKKDGKMESWRVHRRGFADAILPVKTDSLSAALACAEAYEIEYTQKLRQKSEQKMEHNSVFIEWREVKDNNSQKVNQGHECVFMAICNQCLPEIVGKTPWTPRLSAIGCRARVCSACSAETNQVAMFECITGWTGYYRKEEER